MYIEVFWDCLVFIIRKEGGGGRRNVWKSRKKVLKSVVNYQSVLVLSS